MQSSFGFIVIPISVTATSLGERVAMEKISIRPRRSYMRKLFYGAAGHPSVYSCNSGFLRI